MELLHAGQKKKKKKRYNTREESFVGDTPPTGSSQTSFLLILGSGCQTRFYHQRQPKKNGVSDESGSCLTGKWQRCQRNTPLLNYSMWGFDWYITSVNRTKIGPLLKIQYVPVSSDAMTLPSILVFNSFRSGKLVSPPVWQNYRNPRSATWCFQNSHFISSGGCFYCEPVSCQISSLTSQANGLLHLSLAIHWLYFRDFNHTQSLFRSGFLHIGNVFSFLSRVVAIPQM